MIPIGLVADDYGLTPGIGRGIRRLVAAGRLSAVSVITTRPGLVAEAAALDALGADVDIGLHLVLTGLPAPPDGAPGALPRLAPAGRLPGPGAVAAAAWSGRLPLDEIAGALEAQLAAFECAFGRPPDHIDGHHHVHQLPAIRALVARRAGAAWVRRCDEPWPRLLARGIAPGKCAAIRIAGTGHAALLRRHRVRANAGGFSGIYALAGRQPFGPLFRRFLCGLRPGGLIMVHPGEVEPELADLDPLTARRAEELDWLAGPEFPAALAGAGFTLERPSRRAAVPGTPTGA